MRFAKGTQVFTAGGEKVGTISRIVIDAKTRDVTDVVVERGAFPKNEKVIPVGLVDLEKEDRLVLRETNQSVDDFLDYETTHYVPVEQAGAPYENVEANYWYPPVNFQLQVPTGRAGLRCCPGSGRSNRDKHPRRTYCHFRRSASAQRG